jgi:glucosyl-dolichyl phosphate glucuronosyltransferase
MSKVSVVIPTAGAAAWLSRTLASILPLLVECRDADVVVVENGPQAQIEGQVANFLVPLDEGVARRIRYVHEPIPGLLAGRHRGVSETDGDIISFYDDDVVVDSGAFQALSLAFTDDSVELVGGPARPLFLDSPPDWFASLAEKDGPSGFMLTFMSLIDLRSDRIRGVNPNYIWGQNFHIRRQTFFELRGFHPDIVPPHLAAFQGDGETGLTRKFRAEGRRADYLDAVGVRHAIPGSRMTLDFVRRRAHFEGVCMAFARLRAAPGRNLTEGASVRQSLRDGVLAFRARRGSFEALRAKALREGVEFLLDAYGESQAIRDWVHRPDYLDYSFPSTTA